jgi:hypothetical protein
MGFDPHSGQSKVRVFSLSILIDKIVLVVQSTPPSTGSLVSVLCDQPPLICFGVCERKAMTKPTNLFLLFSLSPPDTPPLYLPHSAPSHAQLGIWTSERRLLHVSLSMASVGIGSCRTYFRYSIEFCHSDVIWRQKLSFPTSGISTILSFVGLTSWRHLYRAHMGDIFCGGKIA